MSSHNGNSVHSLMHHEDKHETVEMTTFSHETKDTKDSTLLPPQEEGTITDEKPPEPPSEEVEIQNDVNFTSSKTSILLEKRSSYLLLANVTLFNLIVGFHFMCFGIYYVAWTDAFETTKAAVGAINGVHYITRSVSSKFNNF